MQIQFNLMIQTEINVDFAKKKKKMIRKMKNREKKN